MRLTAARPPQKRLAQRGQVLLILLVILVMGVGVAFYTFVSPTGSAIERDKITAAALAQAKAALIGWSAARGASTGTARPGELPCPDTDDDGFEEGTCAAGRIGRIPWKTLGIPEPRDDSGETLWYAISGPFRKSVGTAINSDTKGTLTVYQGNPSLTLTSEAVAVILSPGPVLGTQSRDTTSASCATTGTIIQRNRCAANYLEAAGSGNNSNTGGPFVAAPKSGTFNDRIVAITTADLIPLVEQRVARDILSVLQRYKANSGCNCYPWPDVSTGFSDFGLNRGRIPGYDTAGTTSPPYALPVNWGVGSTPTLPQWFIDNEWRRIIYYAVGKNFLENNGSGCTTCEAGQTTLSVDGVWGKEVVLLTPGPAAAGRPVTPYPWTNWTTYLDDSANNDNSNDRYITPTSQAYARDRIFTIP